MSAKRCWKIKTFRVFRTFNSKSEPRLVWISLWILEYHQHLKYIGIKFCLHLFQYFCYGLVSSLQCISCKVWKKLDWFWTFLYLCDFTFLICCVENSFDKRYQPVLMKGWWKISHTAWQSLVRRYRKGYCTIWSALPETLCKSFPQMNWITSSSDTWDQVSSLWLRNCDWLRRNSQRSGGHK